MTPKIKTNHAMMMASLAAAGMLWTPSVSSQATPATATPSAAADTQAPAAPRAAKPTKARATTTGHSAALKQNTAVTVNFVNADIEAVTRAMGAMLNKQFIVDPRVKGQITVYSDDPMSVREAYLNYLASLRGLGFTVVESANLLKVVPEADAKLQGGPVEIGAARRRGDQVLTQVFRLNHENPNNLVPVLRPLISPNNTINANPGNQTLVVTDYADNLQRIGKIIAALDNPASSDMEVIPLKHAVAVDLATIVQRMAGGGGGGAVVTGVPTAAGSASVSVLADSRSNSLIVQASSAAKMAQVRSMVARLDTPGKGVTGPGGNIWVVYLKNADATRLAQVLRASFASPQQAAGANGGGFAPAAANATPAQPAGANGGTGNNSVANQPLQGAANVQTGGFIQADPATNSLIITAAEPLYRQIRNVIEQLDSRRAQVFVESMIVKVNAEKLAEMGVQWQGLLGGSSTNRFAIGTNYGTNGNNILNQGAAVATGSAANGLVGAAQAVAAVGAPGAGLNFGLIRAFNGVQTLASMARFLETNTGANVLSTPTLVALDNEEAQIVIGQNVPFITGTFTGATTGGVQNPFQTIERKDVGLTLRVKSQIGEGGTIRMTVYQENSSVASTAGSAGPTTDKSAISTSVVIEDGQIMVLGGLLKDEYTDSDNKVPGLGDIPLAGAAFKAQDRRRVKSNLMVFLRPVVMRTQGDVDSVTIDRYESIRAQQRNFQPQPGVGHTPDGPLLPPIQQPSIVPPGINPARVPSAPTSEGTAPTSGATTAQSSGTTPGDAAGAGGKPSAQRAPPMIAP